MIPSRSSVGKNFFGKAEKLVGTQHFLSPLVSSFSCPWGIGTCREGYSGISFFFVQNFVWKNYPVLLVESTSNGACAITSWRSSTRHEEPRTRIQKPRERLWVASSGKKTLRTDSLLFASTRCSLRTLSFYLIRHKNDHIVRFRCKYPFFLFFTTCHILLFQVDLASH